MTSDLITFPKPDVREKPLSTVKCPCPAPFSLPPASCPLRPASPTHAFPPCFSPRIFPCPSVSLVGFRFLNWRPNGADALAVLNYAPCLLEYMDRVMQGIDGREDAH